MYGYKIYKWCRKSTFQTSGYEARTEQFKNYPIPALFSEYGCNAAPGPRTFDDVPVLFGPDMNEVWSGGIIFMYFETSNNFSLVSQDGSSVSKFPEFTSLQFQIKKATPSGVDMSDYTVSTTVGISCPIVGASWMAASILHQPLTLTYAPACTTPLPVIYRTAWYSSNNGQEFDGIQFRCALKKAWNFQLYAVGK